MKKPTIALCLIVFSSAETMAVIGGVAEPELARHTVMVLNKQGSMCSGAVIGQSTVLTAAHCVYEPSEYAVHFRDPSGAPILMIPSRIITHPNYNPDAIKKRVRSIDLAILQLDKPLPSTFQPVELSEQVLRAEDLATIGGFGLTNEKDRSSNGKFYSSPLKVIEPYGPSKILVWLQGGKIPQNNLNRGGCHGDSGGPIFQEQKLLAITTWTTGPKGYDCGDLTQGVLVGPQLEWISKNIR